MLSVDQDVSASYGRLQSHPAFLPNESQGSPTSTSASGGLLGPMQKGRSSERRKSRTPYYPECVSPNDIMMMSSLERSVGKRSPREHLQVKQTVPFSSYGEADDSESDSLYPVPTSFALGPYDETSVIYTKIDPCATEMRINEHPKKGAPLYNRRLLYQQGSLMDGNWHGVTLPRLSRTRSNSSQLAQTSKNRQRNEKKVDSARQSRAFKPSQHHRIQNRQKLPRAGDNAFSKRTKESER